MGDAVKEYANGGTTACAETTQLVVDEVVATYTLAATPGDRGWPDRGADVRGG